MRLSHITVFAILPFVSVAPPAPAQHMDHADHMSHSNMMAEPSGLPVEPGNGAFAAIAETIFWT